MTQQPWQGPQPPTHPAPSQPTPGQAPLGSQAPAPVSIQQFEARRRRSGVLLALLATLMIAALGVTSVLVFRARQATPTAAPATGVATSAPTGVVSCRPGPRGSTWMSEVRDAAGCWQIVEERWSGDRVVVRVRITVERGSTPVVFFAIANGNTSSQYAAEVQGQEPNLNGVTLRAGDDVEGYVTLRMPRQAATFIMGSSGRNAISGLILNG